MGPWASLSLLRAGCPISLLVSRDLDELPATVSCFDELEASRGTLKMFLGRFDLLRICVTELDVGFEKIGDFAVLALADDTCGLAGEPLAVTEDFL